MPPVIVPERQNLLVAAATSGRLLVFPLADLPELAKE